MQEPQTHQTHSANKVRDLRTRLGLTQQQFAEAMGMTQGNVGHYENKNQTVPPDVARRMIQEAASRGHIIGYEDIYGSLDAVHAVVKEHASDPN